MLTTAQLATLKAAILADPVLNAWPNTPDGALDMCTHQLNVVASPAFVIWDYAMSPTKFESGMIAGATQIDALTQGKRDELFLVGRSTRDCSDVNVRNAINDATGSQATLKAACVDATKKNALLGEKILATGTGTTAAPATAVWIGNLAFLDVFEARK